jgi:hypothetical protein
LKWKAEKVAKLRDERRFTSPLNRAMIGGPLFELRRGQTLPQNFRAQELSFDQFGLKDFDRNI